MLRPSNITPYSMHCSPAECLEVGRTDQCLPVEIHQECVLQSFAQVLLFKERIEGLRPVNISEISSHQTWSILKLFYWQPWRNRLLVFPTIRSLTYIEIDFIFQDFSRLSRSLQHLDIVLELLEKVHAQPYFTWQVTSLLPVHAVQIWFSSE